MPIDDIRHRGKRIPAALLRRSSWWIVPLFTLFAATAVATTPDSVADTLASLRQIDHDIIDTPVKMAALEQRIAPLLASVDQTGIERLSDDDVRGINEAAAIVSFYTNDARSTKAMRRAYDELARRKLATVKDRRDMLAYYVAARMMADAQAFVRLPENADLPSPPHEEAVRDGGAEPSVWRVEDGGANVARDSVALAAGVHVVIVGSPWCGFSRKAVAAIEADPELAERVRTRATWIIPQGVMPGFGEIAAWNREHPAARMALVYERGAWTRIPTWQTPGFYLFRDGALVASLLGWPEDAQRERLRALLARGDADSTAAGTARGAELPRTHDTQ